MADNLLGELRRSAVIMIFGPGAIVDFRADGAPVSAVSASLEEWDTSFPQAGLNNPQRINEPRLQRKLSVAGFRLPPVVLDETWRDGNGNPDRRALVASRFPEWLQCPRCNRLTQASRWAQDPGQVYRYCASCTQSAPAEQKIYVVPVRFVMACTRGHLDNFPWHFWVGHEGNCEKKEQADLYLQSEGPGLGGIVLSCSECGARKSMDGIFSSQTWQGFGCRGRRPWLAGANEPCDRDSRALQRGASNLYFPVIESAISIPPWSDALQEALGIYWNPIANTASGDRATFIRILAENELKPVLKTLGLSPEELATRIEERLIRYSDDSILNIRQEEYNQLVAGIDTLPEDAREFEIRNVNLPAALCPFLSHVVRVVRLREVRALRGFTRINPPDDEQSANIASISATDLDWLPAIEVRGEGIFLAFEMGRLRSWERQEMIAQRAEKVNSAWRIEWRRRYGEGEPSRQITSRDLLIHTFAHALMRQLSLECGYSSAALRERLYVSNGDAGMAGLLIYTATSDSDGTLGGLQRQGESTRIERAIAMAIKAMEWCSSDPLCIEDMIGGGNGLSLAACHACVLAPETACEEYNRFLDRAMLVGLPNVPDIGFFSPLLRST